jgi:hypothetical protein
MITGMLTGKWKPCVAGSFLIKLFLEKSLGG